MPWIDLSPTLVHAWLGGQETGHAIADVLFGDTSPSGRLSLTFPKRLQDTPAYLNFGKLDRTIVYGEGVFVGHRYYEKVDVTPQFYFGFGLSYTKFTYSNMIAPRAFTQLKNNCRAEINIDISNVGSCDGSEVIQIYVSDLQSEVQRPCRELKAFTKVALTRGETGSYLLSLDKYAVSFWSEADDKWKAEAGDFAIIVATSADPKDEIWRSVINLPETFLWSGV